MYLSAFQSRWKPEKYFDMVNVGLYGFNTVQIPENPA
jgi:hypothetical protein